MDRETQVRYAWQFSTGRDAFDERLFVGCDPRKFMDASDLEKFDSLPDEFVVYRGFQGSNRDGLSWTLSYECAEMFANLRPELPKGEIIERLVRKSEVFAVLVGDELEVIILSQPNA